jgi:hypothetical protein
MIRCDLTVTLATWSKTSVNCVDCTSHNGISTGIQAFAMDLIGMLNTGLKTRIYRLSFIHAMWSITSTIKTSISTSGFEHWCIDTCI